MIVRGPEIDEALKKYGKYLETPTPIDVKRGTTYYGGYEEDFIENDGFEILLKKYIECSKRNKILAVPFEINSLDPKEGSKHENMLIFNHKRKTIERYEPHGAYTNYPGFNSFYIDEVIDNGIVSYFRDNGVEMTYDRADETCPRNKIDFEPFGFQEKENLQEIKDNMENRMYKGILIEEDGYCLAWSMWMLDLRLKFPDKEPSELFTDAANFLGVAKEGNLRKFIRGFARYYVDKLDELFKGYKKTIIKILNDKTSDNIHYQDFMDLDNRISKFFRQKYKM